MASLTMMTRAQDLQSKHSDAEAWLVSSFGDPLKLHR